MIELNQLQQLITIAKKGTISKAANELLISQPALSRSMQRLEADLNVLLFDHYKNKVILNKNGELVVKKAQKILGSIDKMILEVQEFDQAHLTIALASCAPAPIWDLEAIIKELYQNAKVTSQIINQNDLISSLKNNDYHLIITPFKYDDQDIISYPYLEEQLYLSLPQNHHLKDKKEISFQELDGETMILYSNIGFWHDLHQKTMPNTKFLIQNERSTFNEIVKATALPSFTTNLSIKREGKMNNRIIIPFRDDEAHVTFYLTLLKKNKQKYQELIDKVKDYYDY